MNIHVIGTVNGEVNEGMRNIATHISRAFEKEHMVIYSGLRQLPKIIFDSKKADVTFIFAWADKHIYELVRAVSALCPDVWVALVQKPSDEFISLVRDNPLGCSYLYIFDDDVRDLKVAEGKALRRFSVGINTEKFVPCDEAGSRELKEKYGFDPEKPLLLHVGHCSAGRGLEDFLHVRSAQRLIISSGMYEDEALVSSLEEDGVTIMSGDLLERQVPYDASKMLSGNFTAFLTHFYDKETSELKVDLGDEIMRGCLLTQGGEIIHERFKNQA